MEYIPVEKLPPVCETCSDRIACLARGEGEWCCDECDHLLERFIEIPSRASALLRRQRKAPGL